MNSTFEIETVDGWNNFWRVMRVDFDGRESVARISLNRGGELIIELDTVPVIYLPGIVAAIQEKFGD